VADRSRLSVVVLVGLLVAACAPAPEADWRVDASRSVPWKPPAGRGSCPVDDTLSPRLSVWRLHEALNEVKTAKDRQVEVSAPGELVMPESLRIREVLRHDPCAKDGPGDSTAVWRWVVLLGKGDRVVDSLELPWKDGVAAGPKERAEARSRGDDPDFDDEWSVEGLDGSCLGSWAQARYGQALDRGQDSESGLKIALAPQTALLRRSRAASEVSVDLRRWKLSRPDRSGVCP